ncbi:MAG: hypothetical protein HY738_07885 [Bacteroidia bacterium]|nr:hypothetical protein [Bacteroidia bacterium]
MGFWIFLVLILTCCSHHEQTSNTIQATAIDSLTLVQTHSRASQPVFYINPDSLTIITPGENGIPLPQTVKAGTPKIVPTNTNIHPAGEPKIIPAGNPDIINVSPRNFGAKHFINPATGDTLQPPKTVPAIDSPFTAGIPEVVIAKDAYIRDDNPENFSSFSKLQGLKHDVIRCMLQDKSGNLWFGTSGGGVSKYDGNCEAIANTNKNKQSVSKCFTHFTEKQGLSNNNVWSILQDKEYIIKA